VLSSQIEYFSEALPIPGRALSLRIEFNHSLLNSIKYLLEACIEVVPSSIFSKAVEKINTLDINLKLSGLLGVIHENFFNAIQKQNISQVRKIVEKINDDEFQLKSLLYINFSEINEYYVPYVKTIFSQERINNVKFFHLSLNDFERAKQSIQRGVSILNKTFPSFFKEFEELVGEILILKAEGLKQGSSSDLFGMIYKSSLFRGERVTDAIDFLIHEQSHLYVHLLNKDDPIVLNANDLHESALREEKRPLMGIYHATFVLARMYHVLNKALSLKEIPEEEIGYCRELLDYYKQRYHVGYDVLKEHAQMTPLGAGLIESSRKLLS